MNAFLSGFMLGIGLISAIGAQNAFVLRQGLRRQHVFAVCLTCAISDAILVITGVAGFGVLVTPSLETAVTLGGAAFLFAYAFRSFWAAFTDNSALNPSDMKVSSLSATIVACLTFTWLNPHVYLDTVVLLGAISASYGDERFTFAFGAIVASFIFFFSLGFGARLLLPLFTKPRSWQILDVIVGVTMFAIGARLIAKLV